MGLKLDLYSVIYNEERILPYWLRHYSPLVDRIFVWDDDSTDSTHEILSKNPKVMFLPMKSHGDNDDYWRNELFPQCSAISRGFADYCIIADADEFIYHRDLRSKLIEEKEKGIQLIRCEGFTMLSSSFPSTDGQIYDEIKVGVPDKLESKRTIHSPNIHVRYAKGRHFGVSTLEFLVNRDENSGIKLLHFRYLGENYLEEKDRKNRERLNWTFNENIPYDKNSRRTMPDRTRGSAHEWFKNHLEDAVNVVD